MPALLSDVVTRHAPRLLSLPGVVGLGEGQREDGPCLIVLVACPEGELPDLPATLDGYPVVVERTGRLRAQSPE
jgi:hypothetical protein